MCKCKLCSVVPVRASAAAMMLPSPRLRGALLLLLVGVLTTQAIYPDGHFDHVTKITNADHLSAVIEESLAADQTLMVRWVASAG